MAILTAARILVDTPRVVADLNVQVELLIRGNRPHIVGRVHAFLNGQDAVGERGTSPVSTRPSIHLHQRLLLQREGPAHSTRQYSLFHC